MPARYEVVLNAMSRSFERFPQENRRESKLFLWRTRILKDCNYGARAGFVARLICSVRNAKAGPEHVVRWPIGYGCKLEREVVNERLFKCLVFSRRHNGDG
jgi:hypothetical protein